MSISIEPAPHTAGKFRHLFVRDIAYDLLLAIDNDDNAPAAIRVADALASRGARPLVLRAFEPMTPFPHSGDSMVVYAEAMLGNDFPESQRALAAAGIRHVLGANRPWPIKTVVESPASAIVDELRASEAELLVMGLHHHGAVAQAFGENTATRVMGKVSVPVVGLRRYTSVLPRRIMVATDFGDAALEAAHLAANMAHPGGTLILLHAALPYPVVEEGDEGAALVQREGVEHAFTHLVEELNRGRRIRIETVTVNGDPATQIMEAAERMSPDLIAVASQRHPVVARLFLGSVSRRIVRDGRWSMLVTPPTRPECG